jgi:hypothetical protein
MVVVQVRDDDVLDRLRVDPDRLQAFADRIRDQALALLRHGLVDASIDEKRAARADDRPDKVIERLQHVVQVAADEILRRFAIVVPVATSSATGLIPALVSSRAPRRLPSARRTERPW